MVDKKHIGLIVVLVLVALLPLAPFVAPIRRDSGIYLCASQQVLNGGVMYRDAWDHKSPGIFWIDELGLSLGGLWGVYALQALAMLVTALAVYALVSGYLPSPYALAASAFAVLGFQFVLEGGNMPEQYMVMLYALAALCMKARKPFLAGLLLGASLLFKPTPPVLVIVAIVLWRTDLKAVLRLLGGAALAVLLGALVMALDGSLLDFAEVFWAYNLARYSGVSIASRVLVGTQTLVSLLRSSIPLFGIAGWLLLWKSNLDRALLWYLPLQLAACAYSGGGIFFDHYAIPLVPVLAMLTVVFLRRTKIELAFLTVAVLIVATAVFQLQSNLPAKAEQDAVVQYIREQTRPEDTVLIWGAEPALNFLGNRRPPFKWAHQYALYTEGYAVDGAEWLRQLLDNAPTLIIDTSATNPAVPPLVGTWTPPANKGFAPTEALRLVTEWILANYAEAGQVGPWPVYHRSEK